MTLEAVWQDVLRRVGSLEKLVPRSGIPGTVWGTVTGTHSSGRVFVRLDGAAQPLASPVESVTAPLAADDRVMVLLYGRTVRQALVLGKTPPASPTVPAAMMLLGRTSNLTGVTSGAWNGMMLNYVALDRQQGDWADSLAYSALSVRAEVPCVVEAYAYAQFSTSITNRMGVRIIKGGVLQLEMMQPAAVSSNSIQVGPVLTELFTGESLSPQVFQQSGSTQTMLASARFHVRRVA